jgi:hypothetical protein
MSVAFWALSTSEITTALHFAPNAGQECPYVVNMYSARGELYRQLELVAPGPMGLTVELDNLMSELLPDSGVRHARVSIEGVAPGAVMMRVLSKNSHSIVSPLKVVSNTEPYFLPKNFLKSQQNLLSVMNLEGSDTEVVVKVVLPGRAPESLLRLDPNSTKVLHLQTEFSEVIDLARKNRIPAYIRVRAKGEGKIAVASLDQTISDNGVSFKMVTP